MRRIPEAAHSSRVKPTFSVTCQWAILPSSTCPRVSVTWNHEMLRSDLEALVIAFSIAGCRPFFDEPVSSISL